MKVQRKERPTAPPPKAHDEPLVHWGEPRDDRPVIVSDNLASLLADLLRLRPGGN